MLLQINEPGKSENNKSDNHDIALGIDFGTTNCVVSYIETSETNNNAVKFIKTEQGNSLIPSVVSYSEEGEAFVGEEALNFEAKTQSPRISSIKRLLGRDIETIEEFRKFIPFPILQNEKENNKVLLIDLGNKQYTPIEISSHIFEYLKKTSSDILKHNKSAKAVVTVPAYFDDAARQATKVAAQRAGFDVLRLINEPTAAALAYGLDTGKEGIYIVYDLGGGTFDVSVLRLQKGVFQVLGTGGDVALGGDDFDHALVEEILQQNNLDIGSQGWSKLAHQAKKIKEQLTNKNNVSAEIILNDKKLPFSIEQSKFNKMIEPLIQKTLNISKSVLQDIDLDLDKVNGVILVGGSTRIPFIQEQVAQFFKSSIFSDIDPDRVVSQGAALQAHALTKGSDNVLLDVTPLSLGLEIMGGLVEKVIERNSPIPVAKKQQFTTFRDGQTSMKIHILQGERETVEGCRSLAEFVLKDIPPMVAGMAKIEVTFSIDANGILSVEANELTKNISQSIEVKPSYGLSEDDMRRFILDAMEKGAQDMQDRLLIEAKVDGQRVQHAIISALKVDGHLLNKSEREALEKDLEKLEKALEGNDRELILNNVEELDKASQSFAVKRMNQALKENIQGKTIDEINSEKE